MEDMIGSSPSTRIDLAKQDLERGPYTIELNDAVPLSVYSRSTTIVSNGSNRSGRSYRSLSTKKLFRRFTSQSCGERILENPDSLGRQEFLAFINNDVQPGASSHRSLLWYITFIEHKFNTFWTLCRRSLVGVDKAAALPSPDDMTRAYKVLIVVAGMLSNKKQLELITIVETLIYQEELLKDAEDEEERGHLYVLVFAFIGWLSMFYEPRALSELKPNKLQITKQSFLSSGKRIRLRSDVLNTKTQGFDTVDQPLHNMLGAFGDIIPSQPTSKRPDAGSPSEFITASVLCYYTLHKVSNIEIEWVDTVSMHLEFNPNQKVLKLFRLPSFCLIMYRHKKKKAPLDQLFGDKARIISGGSHGFQRKFATTSDLFAEILLTYRLIFGQDTQSWKLFAEDMSRLAKSDKKPLLALDDADPLLEALCAKSCDSPQASEVYQSIRANSVQPYYPSDSFPFFGSRILEIQRSVELQTPGDWKSMWNDYKRNRANWSAYWAVLIIGGSTIVLMVMSLVFQIWQVVIAQRQLAQGPS